MKYKIKEYLARLILYLIPNKTRISIAAWILVILCPATQNKMENLVTILVESFSAGFKPDVSWASNSRGTLTFGSISVAKSNIIVENQNE